MLKHCPTKQMVADALTKLATPDVFQLLIDAMEGRLPTVTVAHTTSVTPGPQNRGDIAGDGPDRDVLRHRRPRERECQPWNVPGTGIAQGKTGANVIVGHLAMIGCGSDIGDGSEVGVGAKVGFNVRIGKNVSMAPEVTVDGCTRVMDGVVIGSRAYIGKGCVIHAGVSIPVGAVIPDRTVISNANDLQAVLAMPAMPMPAMSMPAMSA